VHARVLEDGPHDAVLDVVKAEFDALNLEDFRFPRSTTQGSENTSAKGNVPDGLDRVP
jgi:hypothetical protein